MIRTTYNKCLYLDLEFTESNIGGVAKSVPEIIQIGIVEVNLKTLTITRKSSHLVRPVWRPVISEFITNLTGITNEEMKKSGRSLQELCNTLKKEYSLNHSMIMSWGNDGDILAKHIVEANIKTINLGYLYCIETGLLKNKNLREAIEECGLEFEGREHDAMWDAYNLAKLHCHMLNKYRIVQSKG